MALRDGRFLPKSDGPLAEGTIHGAISHVAQTFRDRSKCNPTKDEDGKLSRFLQRLFRGLRNSDRNVKQQKNITGLCPLRTCKAGHHRARQGSDSTRNWRLIRHVPVMRIFEGTAGRHSSDQDSLSLKRPLLQPRFSIGSGHP